jgi:hypothetical protein
MDDCDVYSVFSSYYADIKPHDRFCFIKTSSISASLGLLGHKIMCCSSSTDTYFFVPWPMVEYITGMDALRKHLQSRR